MASAWAATRTPARGYRASRSRELAVIRYDPQDTPRNDIDLWQQEIIVRGRADKPGGRCRCAEQDDLSART
jgi:hypothetical protein